MQSSHNKENNGSGSQFGPVSRDPNSQEKLYLTLLAALFVVLGVGAIAILGIWISGTDAFVEAVQDDSDQSPVLAFLENFGIVIPVLVVGLGATFVFLGVQLLSWQIAPARWAVVSLTWLIVFSIIIGALLFVTASETREVQGGPPEEVWTLEAALPLLLPFLVAAAIFFVALRWLDSIIQIIFKGEESLGSASARVAWNLLIPTVAVLILVAARPLEQTFITSLTDKRFGSAREANFVGLDNYRDLLTIRLDTVDCQTDPESDECETTSDGQIEWESIGNEGLFRRGLFNGDGSLVEPGTRIFGETQLTEAEIEAGAQQEFFRIFLAEDLYNLDGEEPTPIFFDVIFNEDLDIIENPPTLFTQPTADDPDDPRLQLNTRTEEWAGRSLNLSEVELGSVTYYGFLVEDGDFEPYTGRVFTEDGEELFIGYRMYENTPEFGIYQTFRPDGDFFSFQAPVFGAEGEELPRLLEVTEETAIFIEVDVLAQGAVTTEVEAEDGETTQTEVAYDELFNDAGELIWEGDDLFNEQGEEVDEDDLIPLPDEGAVLVPLEYEAVFDEEGNLIWEGGALYSEEGRQLNAQELRAVPLEEMIMQPVPYDNVFNDEDEFIWTGDDLLGAEGREMETRNLLAVEGYTTAYHFGIGGESALAVSGLDSDFIEAFGNTIQFTFISVFFELILGMFVALVVNSQFVGRGALRAAMLIPWAVPTVVSARLWEVMLRDNQSGVFNAFAVQTGLLESSQAWLANPDLQIPVMAAIDIWKTTPFMALLLLAGLQTIPGDIYEAADVDGASKVRQFFSLTLPLLRPTIAVALVFRTLDALRVFDVFQVLLGRAKLTMATYNYETLISNQDGGYAAAIGVVIFIIILIFTIIYVQTLGVEDQ